MSTKIEADLLELKILSSELHINSEYSSTIQKIQRTTTLLSGKLLALESHLKQGFSPLTQCLRPKILKILTKIDQKLDFIINQAERVEHATENALTPSLTAEESECMKQAPSIFKFLQELNTLDSLRKRIATIKWAATHAPDHFGKEIVPYKIGLKLILFLGADHNGTLNSRLSLAIKEQIPFVASRSLLSSVEIRDTAFIHMEELASQLKFLLLGTQHIWDIYALNEFLLFLPKTLLPEKTAAERLEELDFKSDHTLKKISALEALDGPHQTGDITEFFKMFTETPRLNKIFYIVGHGNSDRIAGFDSQSYERFIRFSERQLCRALCISSCKAGGHVPPGGRILGEKANASFWEKEVANPFLVIVRSIGDFPTYSGQEAEQNIDLFLEGIATFLEQTKGQTIGRLRSIIESIEGDKGKNPTNLMKIYFPHEGGVPSGFRPLDEGNKGFTLSYLFVKRAEIAKSGQEKIRGAFYLEILPLIAPISIEFEQFNPLLLSMIPGDAHHYIKKIFLANDSDETPLQFIDKTIKFHEKNAPTPNAKAFFISELIYKTEIFYDLMIYINGANTCCTWREAEKYYVMKNNLVPEEITPLIHGILSKNSEEETSPSDEAIRASSAGQETESNFAPTLQKAHFYAPDFNKLFYQGEESFIQHLKTLQVTKEEKEILTTLLLDHGAEDLALWLLETNEMNPNIKHFDGMPLLSLAIHHEALPVVFYLLEHNVELNVPDSNGLYPLHMAVMKAVNGLSKEQNDTGDSKASMLILDLLLKNPAIDVNILSPAHWPPLYFALPQREVVNKLVQKGAKVDCLDGKNNFSLLAEAVSWNQREAISLLLELKADPNIGNPSGLMEAIYKNNLDVVKVLLDAGGKAFDRDSVGKVPFIEAIVRASVELVALLLENKPSNINITDSKGLNPMLAALFTGNQEKIDLLKAHQVPLPVLDSALDPKVVKMLKLVIYRFLATHDLQNLIAIIPKLPLTISFHKLVWHYILDQKDVKLLREVTENKIVDLSKTDFKGDTLFDMICSRGVQNFEEYRELMEFCLESGTVPTMYHFFKALNSGNSEFIRLIIEKSPYPLIAISAIKSGRVEVVELILDQGLAITPQLIIEHELLSAGYRTGGKAMLAKLLACIEDSPTLIDADREWLWELVLMQKDNESAKLLLGKKISPLLSDGTTIFGKYPTHWISFDVLDLLVKK